MSEDAHILSTWNSIQESVTRQVVQRDFFILPPSTAPVTEVNPHHPPTQDSDSQLASESLDTLRIIASADVSFYKDDNSRGTACVVIMSYPKLELLFHIIKEFQLDIPYISGYLAFREKDIIVSILRQIKSEHPEFYPQAVLVDGNGFLHPRRLY